MPTNTTTTFYAKARDAASNQSLCTPAGLSFVHDTAPPSAPTVTGSLPASPTNATTQPNITGTAEAGTTVRLYTTTGCLASPVSQGSAASGTFSIPVAVLANATTVFYARSVDTADNVSDCSATGFTFVHDATPPPPPTFTGSTPVSPTSASTTPTIAGSTEAGATVKLYAAAGCGGALLGQGVASAGAFAIPVAVSANGTTSLYATSSDPVGNTSACTPSPLVYVHDSLPPAAPATLATSPLSPKNHNSPSVTGTAEASSISSVHTISS